VNVEGDEGVGVGVNVEQGAPGVGVEEAGRLVGEVVGREVSLQGLSLRGLSRVKIAQMMRFRVPKSDTNRQRSLPLLFLGRQKTRTLDQSGFHFRKLIFPLSMSSIHHH
jgi:hypothetical protein